MSDKSEDARSEGKIGDALPSLLSDCRKEPIKHKVSFDGRIRGGSPAGWRADDTTAGRPFPSMGSAHQILHPAANALNNDGEKRNTGESPASAQLVLDLGQPDLGFDSSHVHLRRLKEVLAHATELPKYHGAKGPGADAGNQAIIRLGVSRGEMPPANQTILGLIRTGARRREEIPSRWVVTKAIRWNRFRGGCRMIKQPQDMNLGQFASHQGSPMTEKDDPPPTDLASLAAPPSSFLQQKDEKISPVKPNDERFLNRGTIILKSNSQ